MDPKLKLLMLFDVANDSFYLAQALRQEGVDAHLLIASDTFGMGHPLWTTVDGHMDPYDSMWDQSDLEALPDWVHLWEGSVVSPQSVSELFRMMEGYDLILGQPPAPIYLPFQDTLYMVYETGWMRAFPYGRDNTSKLARLGYANAEQVVMTNPDLYDVLEKLPYIRAQSFLPFVVDTETFAPREVKRLFPGFTVFAPTRMFWRVKGNDRLIQAFSYLVKEGYDANLLLIEWGVVEDIERTKRLIRRLGIEDHVRWMGVVTKPLLAEIYNAVDVVADQFIVGSGAYVMLEAMSCGKPVICAIDEARYRECYDEMPAILNALTPDEIFRVLKLSADSQTFRQEVGDEARKFVEKHHSPKAVAKRFLETLPDCSHHRHSGLPSPLPYDRKFLPEVSGKTLFMKEKKLLHLLPFSLIKLVLTLTKLVADLGLTYLLKPATPVLGLLKKLGITR